MTVYLIQYELISEDHSGREESDWFVDEEAGYFTSREEAETFVENAMAKDKAQHEAKMQQYAERLAAWQEERARARQVLADAGMPHQGLHYDYTNHPSRPLKTYNELRVVEVQEHRVAT